MRRILSTLLFLSITFLLDAQTVSSPDGRLTAKTADDKLLLCFEGQTVLTLADIPFDGLEFVRPVNADYRMLAGKRLHCTNEANEYQGPIGKGKVKVRLFADDASGSWKIGAVRKLPAQIDCQPRGGFVLVIEK